MSSVSYVLPDGTPCDRQGNPLSTRGSSSRSISSYSRGTTSYNLGDQAPQSWPPRADPSRVSERATRGYNPSYYGEIASRAGSKPPTSDRGYTVVEPGPPKGTLMSMGYEKYKGYDEEAYANKEVYTDQRNAIPRVPKGRRTEPYYGDPAMSSTSHGQLLQQAANTANAARMGQELRGNFDKDYIGYYPSKKSRDGHVKREKTLGSLADKYRKKEDEHRTYSGYSYYDDDRKRG